MATVTRKSTNGGLAVMIGRLKGFDNLVAKAGWFADKHYKDGTAVAYVAAIQEYGAHSTRYGSKAGDYSVVIPPRPFMRPTVIREQQNWITLIGQGAKSCLAGKSTPENVLEKVSARAAKDIEKSITLVQTPPLKPATIKARLSKLSDKKTIGLLTKPLVDTGYMLQTVTHIVESAS